MNISGKPLKKLIRSKSGLKIVTANDEDKSPFVQQEPEWIPDCEVMFCTKCHMKFGFTRRRHHCRRCGLIFCSSCCNAKLQLPRMCFFDPVRICDLCTSVTNEENEFFKYQLRTLLIGSKFEYSTVDCSKSPKFSSICICKLSPDHRYLIFDEPEINPVSLNSILSLKLLKGSDEDICGIDVEHISEHREVFRLRNLGDPNELVSSTDWISSLLSAFVLFLKGKSEEDAYIVG
ncbi:unnamed protein product [Bemisia tabaci]|uniref:FYVE-type domain-containing protein n=1 Tax=Bemisia tabaci TaxID=7038 RepID=A0A9P0AB05_BEMTA|nr:PREDICTED: zinc finger FYVE domain-containing protein 21-like [Bemisia tabaci]CAH0389343.1 unnamed protein product [Bemisia tabaci]